MAKEKYSPKNTKVYQDSGLGQFRVTTLKLSKLLAEVWLDTGAGKKFFADIKEVARKESDTREINELLFEHGIVLPKWVKVELLTDSFQGNIQLDESSINEGLKFIWRIPFAPRPNENAINGAEIKEWISTLDKWIKDADHEDPNTGFPVPPNPYIPLAST
jgi:hypothetical protein